jgi:dienelactone hydrolase
MKTALFLATALLIAAPLTAQAEIVTKEIQYEHEGAKLKGFLAYDDAAATPMPGVVIVHEWWGHNDYARDRAKQVAGLGYAAFAADMYGDGKLADTPDEATALSKPFYESRALMRGRVHAALEVLKAQPQVDTKNLGVIGYCFGGTAALEAARAGEDVKGVVSFHGGLDTPNPAKAGEVKAEVLALNGADDKMVPQSQKDAFVKEMSDAGVVYNSVDYSGAQHAFTNPAATEIGKKYNLPIAYDAFADEQTWIEMKDFFKRLFGR